MSNIGNINYSNTFNSWNEAAGYIEKTRNESVKHFKTDKNEGTASGTMRVGNEMYNITVITHRHDNPIARFFGFKKTDIKLERIEATYIGRLQQKGARQVMGDNPQEMSKSTMEGSFVFNNGKGLKRFLAEKAKGEKPVAQENLQNSQKMVALNQQELRHVIEKRTQRKEQPPSPSAPSDTQQT
ncbi:MAG: hypothetical protein LBR92_02940 [Puniceicoccales bacterium]|jgi:hypothetical protein|nr:hypothetical protein [Puniceicoccales bacterium]